MDLPDPIEIEARDSFHRPPIQGIAVYSHEITVELTRYVATVLVDFPHANVAAVSQLLFPFSERCVVAGYEAGLPPMIAAAIYVDLEGAAYARNVSVVRALFSSRIRREAHMLALAHREAQRVLAVVPRHLYESFARHYSEYAATGHAPRLRSELEAEARADAVEDWRAEWEDLTHRWEECEIDDDEYADLQQKMLDRHP